MSDAKPKVGTNRGNAGKGRPKGSANKATKELKEMILNALDDSGGIDYLVKQAREKPVAFLALIGKVLPMTVVGPGADGEHLFKAIERRLVRPDS